LKSSAELAKRAKEARWGEKRPRGALSQSGVLLPPVAEISAPRARPGVKTGEAAERSEGSLDARASPAGKLSGRRGCDVLPARASRGSLELAHANDS
jgi:hypothetical protein